MLDADRTTERPNQRSNFKKSRLDAVNRFASIWSEPVGMARRLLRSRRTRLATEGDSFARRVMAAHRKLAADFGNQADAVMRAARERVQHQEKPTCSTDSGVPGSRHSPF
jgi:hypothetical protein